MRNGEAPQDFGAMRNNPEAQAHMNPLMEISKPDFHLYEVIDAFQREK